MQAKCHDRVTVLPHESVELRSIRQLRKCRSQMMLGIAVKGSFAGKLHPLSKHGQRYDFAALQGSRWTRGVLLMSIPRLAKIIDHDVECSQESIQLDHQLAPFHWNGFNKLTVRVGSLSFQVLSISHQTFKNKTSRAFSAQRIASMFALLKRG
jgi:hypothetical protein